MNSDDFTNRHWEFYRSHPNRDPQDDSELCKTVCELQHLIIHYRCGLPYGFDEDGNGLSNTRLATKDPVRIGEKLSSIAYIEKKALLNALARLLELDSSLPYFMLHCDWSL